MDKIVCNKCGKEIKIENNIVREDYLHIEKAWGYFSKKDKTTYQFDICEECVEEFVGSFKVPVKLIETTELL